MKTVNKILILLLCSSMAIYVGYSLTKGTRSTGSELSFDEFKALMDDVDYTISVDTDNNLVEYLEAGTTVSKLLEKMPIEFIVCDANNLKKDDSAPIASGDILSVDGGTNDDGKTICKNYDGEDPYRLSVLGDVTGEGIITEHDVLAAFKHVTGQEKLNDNFLVKAGDAELVGKTGYFSLDKDNLLMIRDDKEQFNYIIHPSKELGINEFDVLKLFKAVVSDEDNTKLEYYINDEVNLEVTSGNDVVSVSNEGKGIVTSVKEKAGEATITLSSSNNLASTVDFDVEVADIIDAYDNIEMDYLNGDERWSTAINISKVMYPDKERDDDGIISKNVVLVQASGYNYNGEHYDRNYSDGYVATGLAAALEAPVLLVDNNYGDGCIGGDCEVTALETEIMDAVKEEIERLGATNVYIVGGEAAINSNVAEAIGSVDCVQEIEIERVSPEKNGGRIETSVEVANKIIAIKGKEAVKTVIITDVDLPTVDENNQITDHNNEYADAAMVSFVAANENEPMPILYVSPEKSLSSGDADTTNSNWAVKNFLSSDDNDIEHVYLIGGKFNNSEIINEIKAIGIDDVKVISGKDDDDDGDSDRYETNSAIIDEFSSEFSSIVFVNSFVDMISASRLAANTGSVFIYRGFDYFTSEQKAKEQIYALDKSQANLVSSNAKKINKIYYLGGSLEQGTAILKDINYNINRSNFDLDNDDKYLNDFLFSAGKAVFYVAHQGNETLYYSQTILSAIDELGAENVYVVLLTDGSKTGAANEIENFDQKLKECGYETITDARDAEMKNALKKMGVLDSNIAFIEDLKDDDGNKIVDSRLEDGALEYETVYDLISYYASNFGYDVAHFAFSSHYSSHQDFVRIGNALLNHYAKQIGMYAHCYSIAVTSVDSNDGLPDNYFLTLNSNNSLNNRKIYNASVQFEENLDNNIMGIGTAVETSKEAFDKLKDNAKNKTVKTIIHIPYYGLGDWK